MATRRFPSPRGRRALVVLLESGRHPRGGALSTLETVKFARSWDCAIVVNEDGPVKELADQKGLNTVNLQAGLRKVSLPLRKQMKTQARFQSRLLRGIWKLRPGILYTQLEALPWVFSAAALTQVPIAVHVRSNLLRRRPIVNRIRFRVGDRYCVLTEGMGAELTAIGLPSWTKVPGVIDASTLDLAWNASLRSPKDGPSVGIVGSLTPYRRVVEVLEQLVSRLPNRYKIHVFGEGTDPAYVKRVRSFAGEFPSRIYMHGHVGSVEDIYSLVDVVVNGCGVEGMSRVVLEAQAFGIPVVSIAYPGIHEVILDGVTGSVVENEEELSLAVKDAYEGGMRDGVNSAGWHHVRRNFAPEVVARMLEGLWDDMSDLG